jgi:AAA domain
MPALPIISADERLRSPAAVKGQIWGRYGQGKTWLVRTLMESTALASGVLVLDAEAGLLSIQDVPVDVISLRSWTDARDIACFFGRANPAFRDDQPYSEAHYQHAVERYGDPKVLERYSTVFIDSISVVSKLCLNWCKGQPQAVSERTGKPDLRGAYGLLAQELIGCVTQWQHIPGLNVWLVGGLEERTDDFNRRYWAAGRRQPLGERAALRRRRGHHAGPTARR